MLKGCKMPEGFDFTEMFKRLREKNEAVRRAATVATGKFMEASLTQAAELAPVGAPPFSPNDPTPGTLVASAHAEPPEISGDKITVKGGFNTVYAAVQHEDLEFRHHQGQAKYFEQPLREMAPKFLPYVAERVKPAMEG
jgi:hypothetical protein